jgi:hypothetical protein
MIEGLIASVYNTPVFIGGTFFRRLKVERVDLSGNILPVDLTGFNARGQARKNYGDDSFVLDFTCTIPTPANGEILSSFSPAQTGTIALSTPKLVYDIEIYNSGDLEVYPVIYGELLVVKNATQP